MYESHRVIFLIQKPKTCGTQKFSCFLIQKIQKYSKPNTLDKLYTFQTHSTPDNMTSKRRTSATNQHFPVCLHQAINASRGHGVCWTDNGASFSIHNMRVFVRDVLPKNWSDMSLNKFAHMLRCYGFQRNKTPRTASVMLSSSTSSTSGGDSDDLASEELIANTVYTFHCAYFTKDAEPKDLARIQHQPNYREFFLDIFIPKCSNTSHSVNFILRRFVLVLSIPVLSFFLVNRMKEMLSDTNKSILDLKDQMYVSQKKCLSLVQRIKRQMKMKGSMERMIFIESTKDEERNYAESTTVIADSEMMSSNTTSSSLSSRVSIRRDGSTNMASNEENDASSKLTIPLNVLGLAPEQVPRESTTMRSA